MIGNLTAKKEVDSKKDCVVFLPTDWSVAKDRSIFESEIMARVVSGSEILLESLKRQKVDVFFGLPGGAVLPLYDALYSAGIRHLLVRHEQAAAFAADGYARVTGKPGVCLGTSGPGATNLITGLTSAMMDSIPIVALTGQVPAALIGKDGFQEADTIGISLPSTKQ